MDIHTHICTNIYNLQFALCTCTINALYIHVYVQFTSNEKLMTYMLLLYVCLGSIDSQHMNTGTITMGQHGMYMYMYM